MVEYRVERMGDTLMADELQERLNKLAADGWTLAEIDPRPRKGFSVYILRREAKRDGKAVQGFADARAAQSPKTENL